jgi:hypothetical protein
MMIGENIFLFIDWYFIDFPKEILKGIKNYLKFGLHYFSIPFLLKTFFYHWHKYAWQYPRAPDIAKIFEVWISNQISRLIGMILRSFLIFAGLLFEIFVLIFGFLFLFLWLFLPAIWFLILIYGVKFLFGI